MAVRDLACRQKLGGVNVSFFVVEQLPVLPPASFNEPASWSNEETVRQWITPRVLELTYTSWDLEAFGRSIAYAGPPFRWDPERRFLLRAELDAAFFHLYGIGREDVDYILDTFAIVRNHDEQRHGEYRTKRVILDMYDEIVKAQRTGTEYVTRLNPPPGTPSVAHEARREVRGEEPARSVSQRA